MFVQVIQGRVADPHPLRAALDAWVRDLEPTAVGWLGTTAGCTEDGRFVALARFESEEAAQRNSKRPEQDRWWAETVRLFAEEPVFQDSIWVDADVIGDPEAAGFVQVIHGSLSDAERARELMSQDNDKWAAFRPEILAFLNIEHADSVFTSAIYFTTEADAREGERKVPPQELRAMSEELRSLSVGETTFLDLEEPWLYAPSE
jgi:hypothetical protein